MSHHNQEHDHEINNIAEHHHGLVEEVLCHLPYAIFSVALAMIVLSFLTYSDGEVVNTSLTYRLFHNFHFLHLLFSSTGTMLTFSKYSKNRILAVIVGIVVPVVFCTLSDAFLPYLGGACLGLGMGFHWCFISHLDTVLPFLFVGILNGWVMSTHASSRVLFYSVGFHFFHIFISSMASILYLISFGFYNWWTQMGFVFLYMIIVVLVPCTLSDVVVPMLFAKLKESHSKK